MANSQEKDTVKSKHFIVRISDCHGSDGYRCKEHDLSLDYFCTMCKDPICMDCFITKHHSHITKTIKAAIKDAMAVSFHLKSFHAKNKASRKTLGEKAQEVFEKIANDEKEVLEMLQKQQLKMQRFMTCLFDRAKISCRKVFAEQKEDMLLPEIATKSDTFGSRINSLVSLIDKARGNDLQVASHISNLYTIQKQCLLEAEKIKDTIQFMEEKHLEKDITLSINHGKILQSMVELFSCMQLPQPAGEFFRTGITFETDDVDDAQYHNMTTDSTIHSKRGGTSNRNPEGRHLWHDMEVGIYEQGQIL